jgi:serine/threonine-protein kinase
MQRLKREALIGASLNHPNLVSIYDAETRADGDVVLVMEYVAGQTLRDVIRSRGPLPPEEALPVLRGVAAALDAIHDRGIVHRDVKPANVLLGDHGVVKLADLGVAEAIDQTRITSAEAVAGSFSYMPSEQLQGKSPSPSMDIYALAAVAYEVLSGKRARPEPNPLALAHAISTQPPPDLRKVRPETPAAAADVLKRGMSRDPGRRPTSAGQLVSRLQAAFEAEVPPRAVAAAAVPVPRKAAAAAPAPARSKERRFPALAPLLLALAALVAAAVVVVALTAGGGKRNLAAVGSARTTSKPAHRKASVSATKTHRHHAGTTASTSAASTASSSPPPSASASGTAASSGSATPTASAPPVSSGQSATSGGSSAGSAAGAVESFYEAAAQHAYGTAWALADSNMRSQVGGYPSFEYQMSRVRSITFHRAEVVSTPSPDTATVAVDTTSVQTNRTQHCWGTARTVRTGSAWLLDAISISCA